MEHVAAEAMQAKRKNNQTNKIQKVNSPNGICEREENK